MRAWIYFARFGSEGPIKIGRALNVHERLNDLSIGCPARINFLGAFLSEHAEIEERELHKKLATCRIKGEWFEVAPALAEMAFFAEKIVKFEQLFTIESPYETKRDRIWMRLTKEERFAWRAAADRAGIPLSEWIREMCNARADLLFNAYEQLPLLGLK